MIPGRGKSSSCVPIDEVARQMSMVYQDFLLILPSVQNSYQPQVENLLITSCKQENKIFLNSAITTKTFGKYWFIL